MRKSFVLYIDLYESVKDLSLKDKGQLLDSIFTYEISGKVIELTPVLLMAFSFVRKQLDRDNEKWEDIKEKRRIAGSLGGKAKAKNLANQASATFTKQTKQNLANQAVNVTGNVNVIDSVIDRPQNTSSYKKSEPKQEEAYTDPLTDEQAEKMFQLAEQASNDYKGGHGNV